jgi:hypothetical protein
MMPDKHPSSIQPMPAPTHDFARRTLDALDVALGALLIGLGIEVLLAAHGRPFLVIVGMGLTVAGGLTVGRVLGRAALHAAEVVAQTDFNRDGKIGDGPERVVLVNKPVRDDRQRWVDFVTQAGIDSTVPAMERAGFSRPEIQTGRNALMARGLATWDNKEHRVGWRLLKPVGECLAAIPLLGLDDNETSV